MARKKALKEASDAELLRELARRHAEETFREGMTMTEMELAVEELVGTHRVDALAHEGREADGEGLPELREADAGEGARR